ncbi:hypothetical protein RXV86_01255 [Alisedimentitalea sp. MJ-SS2]|uniref:hypothetical protein n=1 Tax=Aliisedimentitalea sp. MJ-SS2 TaxID=3049795 RepID=UPI00290A7F7E|nr:hypothetical protein [Alisedimentitalea sp. MJ-SS2]MDU8926002.1 hypothetical protein [Alisedimentitalea sp. MJ-SS2]
MVTRILYVFLTIATAALYLVMVLWSLPEITIEADGLMPFDLRPFGYSPQEAEAFLNALSDEGRVFYAETQHRLDMVFPLLLMAWGAWTVWLLYPAPINWLFIALAVLGCVFDLGENRAVAGLLEGFDAEAARAASRWTLAKSLAATTVYGAILWALGRKLWVRIKR